MGYKFLLVVALSVYSATAASTRDETRQGLVDWYDCSGKPDGNYRHPRECTKFMSCVAGQNAYEMDCAECHVNAVTCPHGRTHFNLAQNKCLFANETECEIDDGGTGPTPTTEHVDPTTTTTTEGPEPTTTQKQKPQPGDWCDPDDCEVDGWCHGYEWCERDWNEEYDGHKGKGKNGTWRVGVCKEEHNLYFNPDHNSVHGGVCDFWYNLLKPVKDAYNEDPECIDPHCEWEAVGDCDSKYTYFHPVKTNGDIRDMECPEGLLWSQDEKSCLHCSDVYRKVDDGHGHVEHVPCCSG